MIETDAVKTVLQRQHALYLVRLDHGRQNILHREWCFAFSAAASAQIIGHRQDAAQVIRRVTPLCGEPGVIEVEPADHCADIECGSDRFELVGGSRHARTARQGRSRNDRAEQFRACRIIERLKSAGQRVHQAVMRGIKSELASDFRIANVVGNIGQ